MTEPEPERWALGYFEGETGRFVGIVVGDSVRDLRADAAALGLSDASASTATRELLARWDSAFAMLDALATDRASGTWLPAASVTPRPPVEPHQVLQAGANYRKHVIDLAVAHAEIAAGRTVEQVRAETAAMMDAHKAEGIPYFFIGLPSAITGPTDEVVLPGYSQKHDWELELAAVIGSPAFRVTTACGCFVCR